MSFLYPAFLWGLIALAIPIIIHLFNFRRPKKVLFSNVRFLEAVNKKSSSKIRLKHLLALATRLLMILFLVLAFAQPYLPEQSAGLKTRMVYFYLDNSQSMSVPVLGNTTAFDEAYNLINQLVDLYPRETQYKLVTNDFSSVSNSPMTGEEVKELSTELSYSDKSRSLEEVLSRMEVDQLINEQSDVFLISDYQLSTLGDVRDGLVNDTLNNYNLLPISTAATGNLFIDTLYLEKPFLFSSEENRLIVKLANGGNEDALDVLVKFFVVENQFATASVDVSKGGSTELTFDLTGNFAPVNKCRISIEDYPVIFDNEYYFVLKLANRVSIVEIGNDENYSLRTVFANDQLFRYRYYDVGNVDYSAASEAQLVIFNSLDQFNSSLQPMTQSLLRGGSSILVVPSPQIDSASYYSALQLSLISKSDQPKLPLSPVNSDNPFFENIFEDISGRYETPIGTQVIDWPNQGASLIEFINGQTFLARFQKGPGQLYLIASPLLSDYSDFLRHALFVPVMYKIALNSAKENNQLSFSVDDGLISLELDSLVYESVYQLNGELGTLVPNQRIVNSTLIMELLSDESAVGFYDVVQNKKEVASIALNHSKSESEISTMVAQDLQGEVSDLANVQVSEIVSSEAFTNEMRASFGGTNLWKYALVLCLIFLLAEVLILRFL
ncbi:MAG: BatA domain-containing protein [Bacteroidota bacterium]